nr:SDR family oxidoreductase [Paracidobacterium acidisoli]
MQNGKAMRLKDRVAIVTGAGSGIGQGIAEVFVREGAAVVIDYVGKPGAADETLAKIKAAGGRAIAVEADVSDEKQVASLTEQTVRAFGRLDILVNNAGIESKFPFTDFPLDHFQKILAVNLTGPWLCAQAAARQMIRQGGGGRIINISSIHEDLPMPTNAAYCATKGGLRMLMRTIAVELAAHQITVNNIGPGAVYTPIDRDVQANPELEQQLMAEIPLRRWGKPEEIGELAAYLASDAAGYVTGSTFFIDGGMLRNAGSL